MNNDDDILEAAYQILAVMAGAGFKGQLCSTGSGPKLFNFRFERSGDKWPLERTRCHQARSDLSHQLGQRVVRMIWGADQVEIEVPLLEQVVQCLDWRSFLTASQIPNEYEISKPVLGFSNRPSADNFVFPFGVNTFGQVRFQDLTRLPISLIVGERGTGKTNLLRSIVLGLNDKIENRQLEVHWFDGDKGPNQVKACLKAISNLQSEVERRRALFSSMQNKDTSMPNRLVRNIANYNCVVEPTLALPRILLIIDEIEPVHAFDEVKLTECIKNLSYYGRGCGIQVIVSTRNLQKSKHLPGKFLVHFCGRFAIGRLDAASSNFYLGHTEAELLQGPGDCLTGGVWRPVRFHFPMVSEEDWR